MNLPRMLRPLPGDPSAIVTPTTLADAPVSLVVGRAGAYAAESLAGVLEAQGRWQQCVWLRTAAPRPAMLAEQLAGACLHRWAGSDAEVAALPAALRAGPRGAVVVVELRRRATTRLARLLDDVRPTLAERAISLVVVAGHRSDRRVLPWDAATAADAMTSLASADAAGLPPATFDRLLRITSGRSALTCDVVGAAAAWPDDAVIRSISARSTWRGLLDHLTATLVARATADQRAALEQSVATGYCHPQVASGDLEIAGLRPWIVGLEQQWGWLRPVWRTALARHLRTPAPRVVPPATRRGHRDDPPPAVGGGSATLEARTLGPFELRVDGVSVAAAPGHRGWAVLRYLLSRAGHAASRDELLEEFWPDVEPAVARNRLQVAISGVRRALRVVTTVPVVTYRDGGYGIDDRIVVDTDVDRFERAVTAARAAQAAGRSRDALAAYRTAVRSYRGDYASDTPYEQWTLLPREHLRLRYVDALDRMSRLQLDAGLVDECMATAHRILDVDPSREDAHRLLMRCYAWQGRAHQAVRQFELCVRALRSTVDADPSAETARLRDAVLAGSVARV